jgi:hypothetical protein
LRCAEAGASCGAFARIDAGDRPYADGAEPWKRAGAVG